MRYVVVFVVGAIIGYLVTHVVSKPEILTRIEYKHDTVYVPKVSKEVVVQTAIDTFFRVDTLQRIDTVKIIEKCKDLATDYFTKREYLDTIKIPYGKIFLKNDVYMNKIVNFAYRTDISAPTGGWYVGGMVGVKSVSGIVSYQRNSYIYQGMIGTDGVKLGLIYKIK